MKKENEKKISKNGCGVAGCGLQVAGCRLQVTGYRLQVTRPARTSDV
jgi:hypothetical protein